MLFGVFYCTKLLAAAAQQAQHAGLSNLQFPKAMPLEPDGKPKFSLTGKGIRTDVTGKTKLNSSWQDINLEISGVVTPVRNEFGSKLS